MENSVVVQLKGLEREKSRLDALLASDENWREYKQRIDAVPGRPESEVASEISLPERVATALDHNRLFQARRKVLEAIDLLEDLLARPGTYQPPAFQHPDETAGPEEPARKSTNPISEDEAPTSPVEPEIEIEQPSDPEPPEVLEVIESAVREPEAFRTKVKVKSQDNEVVQARTAPETAVTDVDVASETLVDADNATAELHAAEEDTGSGTETPDRLPLPRLARGGISGARLALLAQLSKRGKRDGVPVSVEERPLEPAVEGQPVEDVPEPQVVETKGGPAIAMPASAANDDERDELLNIKGMTPTDVDMLLAIGVTGFVQIARWTAADVRRLRKDMDNSRVSSEQWIEQAAVLARGRSTAYAAARGDETADEAIGYPFTEVWSRPPPPDAMSLSVETSEHSAPSDEVTPPETPLVAPTSAPDPEPDIRVASATSAAGDDGDHGSEVAGRQVSSMQDEILAQAEIRRTALNERIARLEQTISTIVMPDLKRPPPNLSGSGPSSEDTAARQTSPPPSPPRPEDLMSGLPPLEPPLGDFGINDGPTFEEEADVQIVTTSRRQRDEGTGAEFGHDPQPSPTSHLESEDPATNWSPDHLARRLDRLDGDAEDTLNALARYTGDVQEANVEIIRSAPQVADAPEGPAGEKSSTSGAATSDGAESKPDNAGEEQESQASAPKKRRSRRFLSALTGGGDK